MKRFLLTRYIKFLIRQRHVRVFFNKINNFVAGRMLKKIVPKPSTALRNAILASIDPAKKTIALCYPPSAYGENLGEIAIKLRQKGYNALLLRGTPIGETEEQPCGIFPVVGSIWSNIAEFTNIHAYFCLGASQYFPVGAKVVLFVHDIHDSAVGHMNQVLKTQSTFDYFFLPSWFTVERVKQQFQTGREKYHNGTYKAACFIPGGYPKLDSNLRFFRKHSQNSKTIIYATTVMEDMEDLVSLTCYGEKVIDAVLANFPDYDLIFRPHPHTVNSQQVKNIARKYNGVSRFIFDNNASSYMANYSKAAIMISDMSGTAYTYAFTTLRPVVFFSPNEKGVIKRFGSYQYFIDREKVGWVAENVDQMVERIRQLLASGQEFTQRIRHYRDSTIYNIGKSEDYLIDNIEYIIEDKKHPDWIYV